MSANPRPSEDVLLAHGAAVDCSRMLESRLAGPRHGVQFYEDDEFLCDVVARYVGAGLAEGETAILVATRAHWESIARRLTENGFDVPRASSTGRFRFLDARETLEKILVAGSPDAEEFQRIVGDLIRAQPGHVRAFGEMVDLLWRGGDLAAALSLEEMWNLLAEERPLSLLCAYVVSRFDEHRPEQLEDVCRVHTHALPRGDEVADNDDGLDARLMDIGLLQQRARALEDEIARRKQLEGALREALDSNERACREAQTANRVKDDFLATMSHELRTPLNAILGWSAMLRTKPDVDVKKAVDTIERNARAQVRLIEEVLDVSKIMSGKLMLDPKPMDFAATLRAAADLVSPAALAKGITLEVSAEADPCPFHGDAARLQQVACNLLSNAVKFTPKGGRVEARLARSGAELKLTVVDTGQGIRADFLPMLFQRFRQADSSTTRRHGGLGIGLAVVGHLVELHGGRVDVFSAGEGRGATFTVRLPVPLSPSEEAGGRAASDPAPRPLSGLRVMVCDDDADCRDLLHEVLSSEGATVCLAAAAAEALDQFQTFHPDVLVSDIGLPLVDGYALIRQIRQLGEQQGGRIPAIALTAYASSEDTRKALSAGYQLHVTKPVDPGDLTRRVANLAGRPIGASPPPHDR